MAEDGSGSSRRLRPESLMMSWGYRPEWSEGAVKPPVFQTSTFAFRSAEEGKEFFAQAYGLEPHDPRRRMGLIYSRVNNPDLEILEDRLNLWDGAAASAVFSSGMAAISTSLLALVPLGGAVAFARPVYGGTDYLLEHLLPDLGMEAASFWSILEDVITEMGPKNNILLLRRYQLQATGSSVSTLSRFARRNL